MACDNSQKISAWKKSHSSYLNFLRNTQSPDKTTVDCSNQGKSAKSVISRVQSVSLSVNKTEDQNVAVVDTSVNQPQYRHSVYSVRKPAEMFRQGGWTSSVKPRNKTSGKLSIRSYNLSNYTTRGKRNL